MKHFATEAFWKCHAALPPPTRDLADKNFQLLKENPWHPSLHLKRICELFSVRVGLSHRALGTAIEEGIVWFWIGSHAEYDKLID